MRYFIYQSLLLMLGNANTNNAGLSVGDVEVPLAYERLLPCMTDSLSKTYARFRYPHTDAEEHYQFIMRETSQYRNLPAHVWSDYNGPWIENYFISNFIGKPLSYFNGLIPLFIQWVDIQVNEFTTKNDSIPRYESLMAHMHRILRSDVLYVTVSQSDSGLSYRKKNFNNILVLSAGGYGHIPIPLIKGELNYVSPPSIFENDIGFYGKVRGRRQRDILIRKIAFLVIGMNLKYNINMTALWRDRIANTVFNLAPRGVGRQSYRTVEIIQIGRIPVYMYTDSPWVPYVGSDIDLYSIGIVANLYSIREFIDRASNMQPSQLDSMFRKIKLAREYYTYAGVINQMELFFKDPLGPNGGYLRCSRVPYSVL